LWGLMRRGGRNAKGNVIMGEVVRVLWRCHGDLTVGEARIRDARPTDGVFFFPPLLVLGNT
jgi:hypothetical protein